MNKKRYVQERQRGRATRQNLLRAIQNLTDQHGYPPTVRELVDETGISSTSAVIYHLEILEGQGRIKREPYKARSIQVL